MAGPLQVKDFVDPETGEIRRFLIVEPKTKDRDFIKIRKALAEATLKDLDYLNGAIKLLMWFINKALEYRMFNRPAEIFVFVEEVMKELKIKRRTVHRYLKLLKEKGYVIQLRKNRPVYMLNPEYIWLGTAKSYVEYMRNRQQTCIEGQRKSQ